MEETENLISADELALYLNIKPPALYKRIERDKDFPVKWIGGLMRFDKEEVLNHYKKGEK